MESRDAIWSFVGGNEQVILVTVEVFVLSYDFVISSQWNMSF